MSRLLPFLLLALSTLGGCLIVLPGEKTVEKVYIYEGETILIPVPIEVPGDCQPWQYLPELPESEQDTGDPQQQESYVPVRFEA